jgi:hypothetical protein
VSLLPLLASLGSSYAWLNAAVCLSFIETSSRTTSNQLEIKASTVGKNKIVERGSRHFAEQTQQSQQASKVVHSRQLAPGVL